ncbi:hypothetical protein XNC3_240018 [Xenorhabdus nematophila F1]|nr:hypothetical protein D3790_10665 [Xenorhabdus nematophila]CCW30990.1 hypothetical protein XNC3_240018 [Xenorhabdus nematophila F1]CEF30794.1 hypothetical protein XNW1_2850021 [Xenorhabdus nematophila str. Websteri]
MNIDAGLCYFLLNFYNNGLILFLLNKYKNLEYIFSVIPKNSLVLAREYNLNFFVIKIFFLYSSNEN